MSKLPLGLKAKNQLIKRFLGKQANTGGTMPTQSASNILKRSNVPEAFTRFDRHPGYEKMLVPKVAADRLGLRNPFFISHDGVAGAVTRIDGREYINFSS